MTQQHLIFYGCLFVAVILHEVSHGVVASFYGDDTAKRAGRLTLNPIPHIDPLGSIILPAMAVLANLPVLGWAKPVPVNPSRLRNPRRQMLWVGLAGPLTNFSLMVLAAVPAKIVLAGTYPGACTGSFVDPRVSLTGNILASFAVVNLLLGLFNLLPIPPLDGASLIERVLPARDLPDLLEDPALRVPDPVPRALLLQLLRPDPRPVPRRSLPVPDPAVKRDPWGHLARRFFGALRPGGPSPEDRAWVETVLIRAKFALWARQPGHDQRHSAGVARQVEAALAGGPHAGDTRWLACALLHDIGKLASGLGVSARVLATLFGRATDGAGGRLGGTAGMRRRIALYLRHPELGADMIELAGGRAEVAHWAAAHHDPARLDPLLLPAPVVKALVAADND